MWIGLLGRITYACPEGSVRYLNSCAAALCEASCSRCCRCRQLHLCTLMRSGQTCMHLGFRRTRKQACTGEREGCEALAAAGGTLPLVVAKASAGKPRCIAATKPHLRAACSLLE